VNDDFGITLDFVDMVTEALSVEYRVPFTIAEESVITDVMRYKAAEFRRGRSEMYADRTAAI
jgi:hypothetical protein